ncbi:MAG TPA: shikimate dehydrogenase [Actinomycetota bacterium]|nr:shikimate dehydrogenase [Actinomycetota bacterium]
MSVEGRVRVTVRGSSFCGILGWPLDFTLSPRIHGAAFRELGLDWEYLEFAVAPEDLEMAVRGLKALGCVGVNVTMPHKESVIAFLDELSGDARAVGAVNTVHLVGGSLVGHNTDVDGFCEFVESDAGLNLSGARAVVLGSGGAARAVVRALDLLGASDIVVAARRPERAEQLALLPAKGHGRQVAWNEASLLAEGADLVVNATPLGAAESAYEGIDPLPETRWRPGQAVVDLVYVPPSTPLVERARQAGADAWGGLGMLVHQAAASLRIWTGQEPPLELMSAVAVRGLAALAGGRGSTPPGD